mgnify:CR=1 FL=1
MPIPGVVPGWSLTCSMKIFERIRQGQQAEPFFNQYRDFVSPKEVTYKIDHNRAQLHKTDAKFFCYHRQPVREGARSNGSQPGGAGTSDEGVYP